MEKTFLVRCTAAEKADWKKKADKSGLSLSKWVRARLDAVHGESCGCAACRPKK